MNIDAVDVKPCLTTLKPLHAQQVVDFYNEMTTVKGKHIIESGWAAAGITDAIRPAIDLFYEIGLCWMETQQKPSSYKQFVAYIWQKKLNHIK